MLLPMWVLFALDAFFVVAGFTLLLVGRFYAMRAQGCLGIGILWSMAYVGFGLIQFGVFATAGGSEIWGEFWANLVTMLASLVVAGCGWLLWSMRAARDRMVALGGPLGKGAAFVLQWVAVLATVHSLWAAINLLLALFGY